ncbi:MAG: UDP-N-acetylmuramate dehydrogenase [Spirochaetales bacterium]|nr:UDP-N-acetylmuramate dehydrogenase [Spirochaetales bacterium]
MKIRENVKLGKWTTFKIGGEAKYFCEPKNQSEYLEAISFCLKNGVKPMLLGSGANVLFGDGIINRMIISTLHWDNIEIEREARILPPTCTLTKNGGCTSEHRENCSIAAYGGCTLKEKEKLAALVRFGAGVTIKNAVDFAIKRGLSGLEFAGGLPGTIGGAAYMNARCYGSEFSEIIKEVSFIDKALQYKVISGADLEYGYKHSIFMEHPEYCIVDVVVALMPSSKKSVRELTKKNYSDREKKGQFAYPSAGCVFKNDYTVGIPAGKLIDEAGLKGFSIGGAEIYDKHANFIINKKNAKAIDVKKMISEVQKRVKEKSGIDLELELQIID